MKNALTVLGATVAGGGFVAYPWATHSPDRTWVAVSLWAVGVVMVFISRKRSVNGPVQDPPLSPSANRAALRAEIVAARERGEEIARSGTLDEVLNNGPQWQNSTFDLLSSALVEQDYSKWFKQQGEVDPGAPVHVGLAHRISGQVRYLSEILAKFDQLEVRR